MSEEQSDRLTLTQVSYESPRIEKKGRLKHFSGSPLRKDDGVDVLGIGDH